MFFFPLCFYNVEWSSRIHYLNVLLFISIFSSQTDSQQSSTSSPVKWSLVWKIKNALTSFHVWTIILLFFHCWICAYSLICAYSITLWIMLLNKTYLWLAVGISFDSTQRFLHIEIWYSYTPLWAALFVAQHVSADQQVSIFANPIYQHLVHSLRALCEYLHPMLTRALCSRFQSHSRWKLSSSDHF